MTVKQHYPGRIKRGQFAEPVSFGVGTLGPSRRRGVEAECDGHRVVRRGSTAVPQLSRAENKLVVAGEHPRWNGKAVRPGSISSAEPRDFLESFPKTTTSELLADNRAEICVPEARR